ncbi:unnamed protein product [Blepharisma stoltei]|uniref:Uncharacterized protein n=1 Tax=Blepharisma stoltei TaxID=1481888 RepID=A0AAU9IJ16_9CILI|nr:unnamed protein product [Blepharisma stoltei]
MYFYNALRKSRKTRSVSSKQADESLLSSCSKWIIEDTALQKSDSSSKLPSINPRIKKLREVIRRRGRADVQNQSMTLEKRNLKPRIERCPSFTGCLRSQIIKGKISRKEKIKRKGVKIKIRLPRLREYGRLLFTTVK